MDTSIVFFDFKPRGPSTGESNNVSLLKWPWLEQSLSVTDPQNIMLIRIYIYISLSISWYIPMTLIFQVYPHAFSEPSTVFLTPPWHFPILGGFRGRGRPGDLAVT